MSKYTKKEKIKQWNESCSSSSIILFMDDGDKSIPLHPYPSELKNTLNNTPFIFLNAPRDVGKSSFIENLKKRLFLLH